jgi:hypothetical protein
MQMLIFPNWAENAITQKTCNGFVTKVGCSPPKAQQPKSNLNIDDVTAPCELDQYPRKSRVNSQTMLYQEFSRKGISDPKK